jgi:insecticidal toxin complex protein TccC
MANTWDVVTFSALHHNTPKVTVISNAGLEVRQSVYYRSESEKKAVSRISLQRYDTAGYLKHSIDARLSQYYLQDPAATIPNQSQVNTLSGAVLQSKNVDAGMRVSLSNARGLTVWTNDSLGNERTFEYDKLGRVTSVSEKTQNKKAVCCERFVYGDKASKESNGIGRLLKHYDATGLREIKSYSVLGSVLSESRQFLETAEPIDWPEELAASQKSLEQERYTTQWDYNGLGETTCQTDAKANQHRTIYGLAGELVSSSLQFKAGAEQRVVDKQIYSAAGQLLEKRLANGVVVQYSYEEKTQRLSRLHSLRLSDSKSLQDLNYRYDPVGNILEIIDKAQEPGFYANEKTEAVNQYRYDSLYQLIEASGRESQQAAKESATRGPGLYLGNSDASRCMNYTRSYDYDAGGNLYEIQHRGAQSYTQHLTIDSNSNRGIETRNSGPGLVESFDSNGNLLYLNTEQPLQWNSRNQLQHAVQLKREAHSDEEQYRYDASGQRVEKLTQHLAQEQIHTDRVCYLPGLELREHWQTDTRGQNKKITEQLHVIQSDSVRVLHWEIGKPTDIENDSLRYTLTDQLGSSQLELNETGAIINYESYYPYGGTAIWATKNDIEINYKFVRYSGKEQDATGLYYYGYRYYLPWLGRWLSPDPSGISEGLNLFRMVNNNPITFYDTDGKAPIKSNYQSARGDLIYGLEDPRSDYIRYVKAAYFRDVLELPAFTIDSYNQAIFIVTFNEAYKTAAKKQLLTNKVLKKLAKAHSPHYVLWNEYFSIGKENKKFNIKRIYPRVYPGDKKFFVKKGSKLGIEMAASSQMHIHFTLDELDIESIVNKSGPRGASITASELRYVYRNWNRLAGKIHFYRKNVEVVAPWIEDVSLWKAYKPKNKPIVLTKTSRSWFRRFKFW